LSQNGFDERVYELAKLNFLEISQTSLSNLSEKISKLKCLTQLCLTSNRLTDLPDSMGQLRTLKFLDLSFNQLSELPSSMFHCLDNLTSLNLSGNNLKQIPSVGKLQALQELLASKNNLENLPDGIQSLSALAVLDCSHNQLSALPDDLHNVNNLKTADFSDNMLPLLPTSLHRCKKLHLLKVQNNPIKDTRLRKLANDPKATKPLLEYLRRLDEPTGKGKKNRVKNNSTTQEFEPNQCPGAASNEPGPDHVQATMDAPSEPTVSHPHIVIQRPDDSELYRVSQTGTVKDGPRPYLVMCTVHGVVFKSEAQLKAFLRAQEEWHKEIGQLRRRATLATHDLDTVQFPLVYTMRQSEQIQFHVLNNNDATTGDRFLTRLYHDAEADRKTRKQAKFSQLYRYLNTLNLDPTEARDGFRQHMLPVVEDARGIVISLPPLSNCHQTRVSLVNH
uniref:Leucine rich repeat containing 47 n=1 Tax=Echinostoma caproni TaxID=27848 RepID=A0A183BC96_9TREM